MAESALEPARPTPRRALPRAGIGTFGRLAGLALALLCGPLLASCGEAEFAGPPEQMLQRGLAEIGYINFPKAYKFFDAALRQTQPGSEAWQQAIFGKAVSAHQLAPPGAGTIEEARRLFEQLIQEAPNSKYAPRAMMNLGRIAELPDFNKDPVDLPQARQWYEKVMAAWPEDPIAGEAVLRIAGTYIQSFQPEEARRGVAVLENWLAAKQAVAASQPAAAAPAPADSRPQPLLAVEPLASAMYQYLGDTYYYPLNEPAKAVEAFQRATELGLLEQGREGPTWWKTAVLADRLAQAAEKDNQAQDQQHWRQVAVAFYTRIILQASNSGKAYQAQLRLKEMGAPVPELPSVFRTARPADPAPTTLPASPPLP